MSGKNPAPSDARNPAIAAAQPDITLSGNLPAANEAAPADKKADRLELAVRTLDRSELEQAVKLFASTPGWANYAEAFRSDALKIMDAPPSAVIGVFLRDGTLVGTGCAVKEMFDFAYWSITWVFVDEALRGQGVGAKLVRGIEDYAISSQDQLYNNPNCRMILSAVGESAEKFYQRLGYITLAAGPLIDDGEAFMMRDLRGPNLQLKVELRK